MSDDVTVFGLLVLYKSLTLVVGSLFAYMGYRLFLADKINPAGDLQARGGKYMLSLRGGAPGVFFSLFGTFLISLSVFKGVEYRYAPSHQPITSEPIKLLPDRPPFETRKQK